MYNDENVEWGNRNMLTHYDKMFDSNGYLRISTSIGTSDYISFHPMSINLSISNGTKKGRNCRLNFTRTLELVNIFRSSKVVLGLDEIFQNKIEIVRRINDQDLKFDFVKSVNEDQVVKIQIFRNESDFGQIIIPFNPTFIALAFKLKSFIENYDLIENGLISQMQNAKLIYNSNGLSHDIKSLPAHIASIPEGTNDVSHALDISSDELTNLDETTENIEDLDKYIGGSEMTNIAIAEIDKKPSEKNKPVESPFIKNVLENDLHNFESLIDSMVITDNPIENVIAVIQNKIGIKDLELLPGISDIDRKATYYFSKLYYFNFFKKYIENNIPVDASLMISKYNVPDDKIINSNKDIALDLLLIHTYVKQFRLLMESKDSNGHTNGSLFCLAIRCLTDPMTYSIIEKMNLDTIKSQIMDRFKLYTQGGFFNYYNNQLKENLLNPITENDINTIVMSIIDVIKTVPFINEMIDELHKGGHIKLPSINNFGIEQIIKEIVPLEVAQKLGKDLTNDDDLYSIPNIEYFSKESIDLFKENKNVKPPTVEKEKMNNLFRFVKNYRNEIPKNKRDEFLNFIKDIDTDIDCNILPVDLTELGDNIVKAIYNWNPSMDDKVKTNYKHYFSQIENESLDKEMIIALLRGDKEKEIEPENNEWSDSFGSLDLS